MPGSYTEHPHNMEEIDPYIITEKEKISEAVWSESKCYFYDTCSFRRHANLDGKNGEYLLTYLKQQNVRIFITRCILMELASGSGVLNPEYVQYMKQIHSFGIPLYILYEEDLFDVLEECFSTNAVINDYLRWAVRMISGPVSTITKTLEENSDLWQEVIRQRTSPGHSQLYRHFFENVRAAKESGDNLGEEMITVCLHILSHLPGKKNGEFCMLTDDKGAAGKLDVMQKKMKKQYSGKKIGIYSTPKLVQIMYQEHILCDRDDMIQILGAGTDGKIGILGMRAYDLRGTEISLDQAELADLIMRPNGIYIIF